MEEETMGYQQHIEQMDIKKTIDINPGTVLIPPPEALIQKSTVISEPPKTGAPINFVKL